MLRTIIIHTKFLKKLDFLIKVFLIVSGGNAYAVMPIFDTEIINSISFYGRIPRVNSFSPNQLHPGELLTINGNNFNVNTIKSKKIALVRRVFANDPSNTRGTDTWVIIYRIKPKKVTKNKIIIQLPYNIYPNYIWSFLIPNQGRFTYNGGSFNQSYWLASSIFLSDPIFYILNNNELGPGNDTSSDAKLLTDWPNTTTAYFDNNGNPMIAVCFHDYECEDGDMASVLVNFKEVMKGELKNNWSCNLVSVLPGKNRIAMYAINGTGYKGNCSYADSNTGEIGISGLDSTGNPSGYFFQQWKIRGGAGTNSFVDIFF